MGVPLTRPTPPRLSKAGPLLRAIEDRGVFSNFGPVNTAFEAEMLARMFGGEGACMTVCNATIGLTMAVQNAIGSRSVRRRYALMPSFTFAATAHAATWCGLTPLFCDINETDWAASATSENEMLSRYGADIAVVMPYATFGHDIDLARYEEISRRYSVPVVVDAPASLGTVQADGRGFGAGFSGTVVFSMHATKLFATGAGGLLYSANREVVRDLRTMANFGFGRPRVATMAGLSGKLSEVGALLGQLRLGDYDRVMDRRAKLMRLYRRALPNLTFQPEKPARQAHQFASALLPPEFAPRRAAIQAAMAAEGIGTTAYFSQHLGEQDYFVEHGVNGPLPVTASVASRIISLPLFDTMKQHEVATVTASLQRQLAVVPARRINGSSRCPQQAVLPAHAALPRPSVHPVQGYVS